MAQIDTNAEQPASFEELTRKAEEEAGVPKDTDLYSEYLTQEPEASPVEADTPPAEEEPTTEIVPSPEEPVEAEPTEEETPGEAVEAKAEPDKLDELNKKLGQLLNENAELRRQQEDASAQTPQLPLNDTTVGWFDQQAEQNPLEAAYWALQNGQPVLYDRAIRVAYEQDPVAAGRYERQVEAAQQEARLAAQFQPQIADAQKMAQDQQVQQALSAVASRHEDFAQVVGTLDAARAAEIIEDGFPAEVLHSLAGPPEQKEKVFETLYRWVKAEQTGQLVQAAQETAGKQAEESRSAKVAATVASASTTTPEAVPETEEERFTRFLQAEKQASMRGAWQGQESRHRGR